MTDQRLLPQHRLRRDAEYQRVFDRKCSAGDSLLVVYGCGNVLSHPRLGMAVSRKVGGAVVRNRWKRLIREAFRLSRGELPTAIDLVVIPRRGAKPELEAVRSSLMRLGQSVARKLVKQKS